MRALQPEHGHPHREPCSPSTDTRTASPKDTADVKKPACTRACDCCYMVTSLAGTGRIALTGKQG